VQLGRRRRLDLLMGVGPTTRYKCLHCGQKFECSKCLNCGTEGVLLCWIIYINEFATLPA
jgi:DNA-directed RNA polymerase subunit RPC12/RpoP